MQASRVGKAIGLSAPGAWEEEIQSQPRPPSPITGELFSSGSMTLL